MSHGVHRPLPPCSLVGPCPRAAASPAALHACIHTLGCVASSVPLSRSAVRDSKTRGRDNLSHPGRAVRPSSPNTRTPRDRRAVTPPPRPPPVAAAGGGAPCQDIVCCGGSHAVACVGSVSPAITVLRTPSPPPQATWRMHRQQRSYLLLRRAAVAVQATLRGRWVGGWPPSDTSHFDWRSIRLLPLLSPAAASRTGVCVCALHVFSSISPPTPGTSWDTPVCVCDHLRSVRPSPGPHFLSHTNHTPPSFALLCCGQAGARGVRRPPGTPPRSDRGAASLAGGAGPQEVSGWVDGTCLCE